MSPEQREMARRNTVNEDREDEYETAAAAVAVNGDAIVVDDEEIVVGDGNDHLPTLVSLPESHFWRESSNLSVFR